MPSHARQQIREAIAAAVTGLASTGNRVYQSRLYALRDPDLPCLLVNTDDEDIAPLTLHGPAQLERDLQVQVRGVAKVAANLDDTLDTLAAEVETALGNTTLSGLVRTLTLESIRVEFDDGLDKPVGVIALGYRASYFTVANAPTTAI